MGKMGTRKLKLNRAIQNHKKDDVIDVECDEVGIPLDSFWRKRLIDSRIDHCVEFVEKKEDKSEPKIGTKKNKNGGNS